MRETSLRSAPLAVQRAVRDTASAILDSWATRGSLRVTICERREAAAAHREAVRAARKADKARHIASWGF